MLRPCLFCRCTAALQRGIPSHAASSAKRCHSASCRLLRFCLCGALPFLRFFVGALLAAPLSVLPLYRRPSARHPVSRRVPRKALPLGVPSPPPVLSCRGGHLGQTGKTSRWNPATSLEPALVTNFVAFRVGGAYDARARGLNRKFLLITSHSTGSIQRRLSACDDQEFQRTSD